MSTSTIADASNLVNFQPTTNNTSSKTVYYSSGFNTTADFHKFCTVVENANDFPVNYIKPFINTTNQDVLQIISQSHFMARKLLEALRSSNNPFDPLAVERVLKILNHVPFKLSVLSDQFTTVLSLVKDSALKNNKVIIADQCIRLIDVLQAGKTTTVNKRSAPDQQSPPASPPPTNEPKRIKLMISKDPPAPKPKAMVDHSFLRALEAKNTQKVRPIYYDKDAIHNNHTDSSSSGSESPSSAGSSPRTIHSPPMVHHVNSTVMGNEPIRPIPPYSQKSPLTSPTSPKRIVPPYSAQKANRRRVTFAANLVEVREYEKNPDEWLDHDIASKRRPNYAIPCVNWTTPRPLFFNVVENPDLMVHTAVVTSETRAQDLRELHSLRAHYTSEAYIPFSPQEPEESADANLNTKVIPLQDAPRAPAPTVVATQAPVVQQQPVHNEELFNALTAAINNMPQPPPSAPVPNKTGYMPVNNNTTHYNQAQSSTGYNQGQSTTRYNQAQNTTGYNQAQSTTRYNQAQSTTGYNQTQSANRYNQAQSTRYNQAQSTSGYNQAQNTTRYNQAQSTSGYNQAQNTTGYNQAGQYNLATPQQQYPAKAQATTNGISNEEVEAMLRNNPNIMNTLKNLSFLSEKETTAAQQQGTSAAQQQATTAAQQQHSMEYRNENNYRPRSYRDNRCHFYNTDVGCKRGVNCPFEHVKD